MRTIYTKEYKEIIKKLIDARNAKGLTQVEVSIKLKKSQSFVSKVESCQRRLDVLELKALAGIYSIDVSRII